MESLHRWYHQWFDTIRQRTYDCGPKGKLQSEIPDKRGRHRGVKWAVQFGIGGSTIVPSMPGSLGMKVPFTTQAGSALLCSVPRSSLSILLIYLERRRSL